MRLLTILAILLAMTGTAFAQQKPPAKPAPPPAKPAPKSPFTPPAFKITVATEAAFPPFNYLDRKGIPAGFEMELAQELCQRMKAECEFTAFKWDDLIPGLIDKKFDIIMSSMEVTSERRKRMGLSRRYYLSPGAFIAAKGAPFDGPPSLLRNDVSGGGHWLKVLLVGVTSNRSAIGGRVTVRYGDRTQTQEVTAQSSFYSANDRRLHFGLGPATSASLAIRWPNGGAETIPHVDANQLVVVKEGAGILRTDKFK
jgi:ABC-type amino acid transport substrate-binding protein